MKDHPQTEEGLFAVPAHHAGRKPFEPKPTPKSQLKTWVVGDTFVTSLGVKGRKFKVAELVCPRRGCGKLTIVVVRDFWHPALYPSAPCPYCFKPSKRGSKP